ncbi:uncharacterized protein SCHCODRAFT_02596029 [Schizophyllum commune H4-8]|uniref:MYND-type domain-containing protein n=1 Tax=Schizophyllum commune (strain H4-8 / FGSC 9210) TaxID=578458 RepID=D8PVB5_SCHCM|nr:uncharacterized protein SCHCODRAFT_02596029 [Schizophyllum commune H4-8]KAI5900422.1 hypothetical protein SCHCODRAFT_02596029 [Schizophyllum commune H4-8]
MPDDTALPGFTPPPISSWSQGRLGALIEQLLNLSMPDQQWDRSRRRATLIEMDRLFRIGRPLREIEGAPPTRNKGDAVLLPECPVISAAMTSLGQFGIACINLREIVESDQYTAKAWQHLGTHVPRVLDWITFLHPMNGNVLPAADTQDHAVLCSSVIVALKGVCTPALFGGADEMREYLLATPTLLLVVDFWVNIFRYTRHFGPEDATVLYSLETSFQFAFEGILPSEGDARLMPNLFAHTLQTRVDLDVRGLYRTIARYAALVSTADNMPRSDKARPYNYRTGDIYILCESFLDYPGLQPMVCPREVVRSLVRTIKEQSDEHVWRASGSGIVYLADLWSHTGDNRIIAWSFNDGFFDAFLRHIVDAPSHIERALRLAGQTHIGRYLGSIRRSDRRTSAGSRGMESSEEPVLERSGMFNFLENIIPADLSAKQGMRACACGDAWYCSVACQTKHWAAGHCEECLPPDIRSLSPRDQHYIALLAQTYVDENRSSIDADVRKAGTDVAKTDLECKYCFSVVIDLRPPVISHKVWKVEGSATDSETSGAVYACWIDRRKARQERVQALVGSRGMDTRINLSYTQSQFQILIEQLHVLSLPDQQTADNRRKATETMIERPPAARQSGDPLLHPDDPSITGAWASLGQFGTLCINLREFVCDDNTAKLWRHIFSYVPAILAWLELLHPMNGHLVPLTDSPNDLLYCNTIITVLQGMGTWYMYDSFDSMMAYICSTPVILYAVDLWVNLARYSKQPNPTLVWLSVQLVHTFAFCGVRYPEPDARISHRIGHIVQERLHGDSRGLCRTIADHAAVVANTEDSETTAYVYQLGIGLLRDIPNLTPRVCSRGSVKTVLSTMQTHQAKCDWRALGAAFTYLLYLWEHTVDYRPIEWSLNDGVLDVILRTISAGHPEIVAAPCRALQAAFMCWRVLHAFHRIEAGSRKKLRLFTRQSPEMNLLMASYDTRITVHQRAREDWRLRKSRCSYQHCLALKDSAVHQTIRSCICRGAWYCSAECQKKHWRAEHRKRIAQDAFTADSKQQHRFALVVDMWKPKLSHEVTRLDKLPLIDGVWKGVLFALWLDRGRIRKEQMASTVEYTIE